MSNGGNRVILNTRERVISNDHNRLQDMIASSRANALARLHNDRYDERVPGYAPQVIIGGQTPMLADVFGGLFVKVDDATSLLVDPGVVGVMDPDPSPGLDDNPYKVIDDPGIQTLGVLTWLANSGGGIRIDLVVADVVEQVIETDNRDVYDTSTGLFTTQTVNKVMAKRLAYSIVRGTPGSGMPAIPNRIVLAVASVPVGSTGWADCTFWDVRPMVSQRINSNITLENPRRHYEFGFSLRGGSLSNAASTIFDGTARTEFDGYLVGGTLVKGTPGGGDVAFDIDDPANATNNATMATATDEGCNPVFLLFPAGLPRWARYSVGNAPGLTIRAPYGCQGILVAGRKTLNDHLKIDATGKASGVTPPSSTGLTGTSDGVAICVANLSVGGGGNAITHMVGLGREVSYVAKNATTDGVEHYIRAFLTTTAGTRLITFEVETDWWTNGLVTLPRNAKALSLVAFTQSSQPSAGTPPPSASDYDTLNLYVRQGNLNAGIGRGTTFYNLGDGTIIPGPLYGNQVRIELDLTLTPIRLDVGINDSTLNQWDVLGADSKWEFAGGVASIFVLGYEV
jgi:hypothetical protein